MRVGLWPCFAPGNWNFSIQLLDSRLSVALSANFGPLWPFCLSVLLGKYRKRAQKPQNLVNPLLFRKKSQKMNLVNSGGFEWGPKLAVSSTLQ